MEKMLLILTMGLPGMACAQFEPERYLGDVFAQEDMSNPYGPPSLGKDQKGIYFWRPKDEWYFTTTMTRVADSDAEDGIGYVNFVSTHTEKSYHPVGVSFGNDAFGKAYSIDLSALHGDSVFIEVENRSNQDLNIRVGLKDVNNQLIDTKAGTSLQNISSGIIDLSLPAKTVKKATFVYQGGFYAEWGDKSKCNLFADPSTPSTPCGIQKFDFKKVVGANITINSYDGQKYGVENAEIRIREMRFGSVPKSLGFSSSIQMENPIVLYPNPSHNGFILTSQPLSNVQLINALGEVVFQEQLMQKIDVSRLPSGPYYVHSAEGSFSFIVD